MAIVNKAHPFPIVTRAEARAAAAKRYFTGKPCPSGHITERQVSSGDCIICLAARSKAANEARRILIGGTASRYFSGLPCKYGHVCERYVAGNACVACDKLRCETKRAANPEKMRNYMAAYYVSHSEEIRTRSAAWGAANPERVRASAIARHNANPEARGRYRKTHFLEHRAHEANRRAQKRQSGEKHTAADVRELFILQRGKCAHSWCKRKLRSSYHVDHIIPLALGGSNGRRNIQLLCQPCNQAKYASHPIDFAQRHGMLL